MNTGKLTRPFRAIGLMPLLDKLKYQYYKWKNRSVNRAFRAAYPQLPLPPDYLMFESYQLNYRNYYEGGRKTARWLQDFFGKYAATENARILDWGCGPGRVIRHLPEVFGEGSEVFGVDYNEASVQWCRENLPGITVKKNEVEPPLDFPDSFFDLIYGISIFTHLSAENHSRWFDELIRIAKPGALLLFSTHGKAYKAVMTEEEKASFDRGELVVRGGVKEGHRVFGAYHPPAYLKALFSKKADILEHQEGKPMSWGINQDFWLLQKH